MDYTKDSKQPQNQTNDFDPNVVKNTAKPLNSTSLQDENKKGNFQLILTLTIILAIASLVPFLGILSIPALVMSIWILSRGRWGYGILTFVLSVIGLATSPLILVFIGCMFTDCKAAIEESVNKSFDKKVDASGKVTYVPKKTEESQTHPSATNIKDEFYQIIKEGEAIRKTSEYFILVEEPIVSDKLKTRKIFDYSKEMCKSATTEFCEVYSWEGIGIKDYTEITPEIKKSSHGKYTSFGNGWAYLKVGAAEAMDGSQEKWQVMAPGFRYIGGVFTEQKPYVVHMYIDNEKLKNSNIQELDSFGMKKNDSDMKTGFADAACKQYENCFVYFYYDKEMPSKVNTEIEAMQQSAGYYRKERAVTTTLFKD